MLFNSYTFAVFFIAVFVLFWLPLKENRREWQNIVILVAGYVFYGWWDWRFLTLIFFTSLTSWGTGLLIERNIRPRLVSGLNIAINIGILFCFKYFNFFIDGFVRLISLFGIQINGRTLDLILPVGISFYTFQALSYSIDVYRGRVDASHDPIRFFAFVSFFPALVAGPIERAQNLLPQFDREKMFDYEDAVEGALRILYGLFLKIMIADRLAVFVDGSWKGISALTLVPALVSVIFFAFQLYLDFASYSEIAKGIGKLLGFKVMTNFKRPYLSKSFREFWKRWHISLSSWFMDYVYIPLGGNRKGEVRKWVNLLIVFLLSGLWHGASWTFVLWGIMNGLLVLVFDRLLRPYKSINRIVVFLCWSFSLVLFRASDFQSAILFIRHMFIFGGFDTLSAYGLCSSELIFSVFLLFILLLWEIVLEKDEEHILKWVRGNNHMFNYFATVFIIILIVLLGKYGAGNDSGFIYFQF